jgi:large subunit ribosomal protein L18Ae
MKCKGDLKEYQIIGRKLPTTLDPNPQLYKMQIFANDTVAAKSRFWYFVSFYKKVNKTAGEIVECTEITEKHLGCVKNYGIWIRYDSRSTSENMYREYRDVSLALAVTQMYRDMAGRHRARPGSIQILKAQKVSSKDCRRPQNLQMHNANIKFTLPRRVMTKKAQHARRFSTSRPTTCY